MIFFSGENIVIPLYSPVTKIDPSLQTWRWGGGMLPPQNHHTHPHILNVCRVAQHGTKSTSDRRLAPNASDEERLADG